MDCGMRTSTQVQSSASSSSSMSSSIFLVGTGIFAMLSHEFQVQSNHFGHQPSHFFERIGGGDTARKVGDHGTAIAAAEDLDEVSHVASSVYPNHRLRRDAAER